MASGLVLCRIQRPDTWQLRPAMCKKVDKTLAKPEPSTHGASETTGYRRWSSAFQLDLLGGPEHVDHLDAKVADGAF